MNRNAVSVFPADATEDPRPAALALGFFDGVHPAHLSVLRAAVENAGTGACCVAVTFDEHPAACLAGTPQELLQTLPDRIRCLLESGADHVAVLPFRLMRNVPAADFLRFLKEDLHAVSVSAGYDYRFGRGGSGSVTDLQNAFTGCCRIIPAVEYDGKPISSTRIREQLRNGDAAGAAALMGRPFSFSGTVGHGKSLGHTLGFPTLNIPVPAELVMPAAGVYVSLAVIGGTVFGSVTNISSEGLSETHVFDYSADTYGQTVEVRLLERLRPMHRFPSWDALAAQVEKDKAAARKRLAQGGAL